jgi:hypothetical protein
VAAGDFGPDVERVGIDESEVDEGFECRFELCCASGRHRYDSGLLS